MFIKKCFVGMKLEAHFALLREKLTVLHRNKYNERLLLIILLTRVISGVLFKTS